MLNVIRPYITRDEPFGPIDSNDIHETDIKALEVLFEQHNRIYANMRNRPSIIVGRKGSGKTYYLRSVYFDKQYSFYTEIRTARVLGHLTKAIESMNKVAIFPEMVAELWETILWISVFCEIRKQTLLTYEDLIVVDAYLGHVGVRDNEHIDDILWKIADMIVDELRRNPKGVNSEILRRFEKVTFEDARSVVVHRLEENKKNFVILLDSLENFELEIDSVGHSLQGLLKFVGAMNKPRDVVDIRFCLPAEIYKRLIKISSNPNKDFRRALKLQWTASELVLIGAQRLRFYLGLYHENFLRQFSALNPSKRNDALTLFQAVLPEKVMNQAGFLEDTMSYILRHTQLLPRHFLMFLTSIFKSPGTTSRLSAFPLSEERIIRGVRQVEEIILSEIFVAFKLLYPTAEETCKRCIPHLSHKFNYGDLHRNFTENGKAVLGSNDLFEFQRMLIEIGALGKVIAGKETDVYIKGYFEYTIAHELILSKDDVLCIHPLFSGIFNNGDRKDRPVYPYGSVLNDGDYRDDNL